MLPFAYYLLKVVICSGILYCYYLLALRNKCFHQYNRFYLLSAVALSFTIPFMRIEFWKESAQQSAVMKMITIINEADIYVIEKSQFNWDWNNITLAAFVFISLGFLLSLIVSLIKVFTIIKRHPKKFLDKICFVFSNTPGTPFSFFKYIFWNEEIDIESDTGKHILKHELAHVHEIHSGDKLFLNLMLIIGWGNPFLWLIRKELNMIHEFIADQKAVSDADSLALMLLKTIHPMQSFIFTNSFFYSPIKRRILMLTNLNPRYSYIRRVMVLPLLTVVILFFAFRHKEKKQQHNSFASASFSYTLKQTPQFIADSSRKYPLPGLIVLDGKKMTLQEFKNLKAFENHKESNFAFAMQAAADTVEPAQFPGGANAWRKYLEKNLDANVLAKNHAPSGMYTVKLAFDVSKEGTISNIIAETKPGYGTEEEAIKVIAKGPRWEPAKKDGSPINTRVKQMISFMVSDATSGNDSIAQFPGGLQEWRRYLERNADLKVLAEHQAPEGKYPVTVSFTAGKDGSISNIVAETKTGYGTEEVVVKAISRAPKWQPEKKDGAYVDSQVTQTLTFTVVKERWAYVQINSITVGNVKTVYKT